MDSNGLVIKSLSFRSYTLLSYRCSPYFISPKADTTNLGNVARINLRERCLGTI
jgi:hypothetical protein